MGQDRASGQLPADDPRGVEREDVGEVLCELQPGALVLAAGTRVTVPANVSTKDVPVGALVRVTVTRTERGEWIARQIEHEPKRNGKGR